MLSDLVTLFDVDNTLLDNDRFQADLGARIRQSFGSDQEHRYWSIYERRRGEMQVADYLGSLQEFRAGLDDNDALLGMSSFLLEYPFAERLFPDALRAIAAAGRMGRAAILSDGDVIFQPRKIQRSGIWDAVHGHVMIYVHKERVLDQVEARYRAAHYVMVDDKPNLLAAMKNILGDRLTTIFVKQGHYAAAPESATVQPRPDIGVDRIGDIINLNWNDIKVRP